MEMQINKDFIKTTRWQGYLVVFYIDLFLTLYYNKIMKYKFNQGTTPLYIQLYNQIKSDIVSGAYKYGAKIPSKRILSEELNISVITIEHAYDLLIEEGYIESKSRSGFYVIYKKDDFLAHSKFEQEIFNNDFELKQNDYERVFPFSVLSKTMRKVVLEKGETLLDKSHYKGLFSFRQAIGNYLKRSVGINVNPSQIVIGAGAEYLYSLVIQLLGRDKIYGIEDPSYEKIKKVYQANDVKVELLRLGNNGIKTHSLNNSISNVLHVTPYNSYPSLITADASKRQEYLLWAKKRNAFIIEDNYDSELTISKKHEETLFSLTTDDNVIYINTFSKTISPSFRVGYMLLPQCLMQDFENKIGFYSCTVPVLEQCVIEQLLNNGEFERNINRIRRLKRKK